MPVIFEPLEQRLLLAYAGLVGHWTLDDGSTSVVNDSSSYDNDGTLYRGATWTNGIVDVALRYDGSSGRVLIPNAPQLNPTGGITLAAWLRPERIATQYPINKASSSSDGYELSLSSSGQVFVRFNRVTGQNAFRVDSTSQYPSDGLTWMHVAATYDGSVIRLYIDGVLNASRATNFALRSNTLPLALGGESAALANAYKGAMDDVHVLNRAMTAAEIAELADKRATPFEGNWSFDEGAGGTAADASGASLTATLSGGTQWMDGIIAGGLRFNGSTGRATVANAPQLNPSSAITIAAWLKPEKLATQYAIKKSTSSADGCELSLSSSGTFFVRFNRYTSQDAFRVDSVSHYSTDGLSWTHVAATYDGSVISLYIDGVLSASREASFALKWNSLPLTMGGEGSATSTAYAGAIDDVRVLNRALTPQDVADLAAQGTERLLALNGRWAMDEGAGTTVADSSAFALNGTVSGGAVWTDGVFGSAIHFNGSDGRVLVPNAPQLNPNSAITITAWIKPERVGTQYPIKKATDGINGYELSLSSTGTVFVRFNRASSQNAYRVDSVEQYPRDGKTWLHAAATYDGSHIRLYIDGALSAEMAATLTLPTNALPLSIGGEGTSSFRAFGGAVDDVRIHNRSLSAPEVEALYASGFGLATPLTPMPISRTTGEKPQSKVWEYDGSWWGVFPNSSGTYIWRLDDNDAWSPALRLSSSTTVQADTRIVGDLAHVLLYDGSGATRLASAQYVDGPTPTYTFWSERPGLVNVPLSSGVETATIEVDSTGRMWVAWEGLNSVQVRHSDWPYLAWSESTILASGLADDDIAAVTALPGGQIGVMWSNQGTQRFGFRTHSDLAAPEAWDAHEVPANESALPLGNGMADDHINFAVASDGTLYAAIKTSYDVSGSTMIGLLVRRPWGVWDPLYTVDTVGTRPIVVVDESSQRLLVAYTADEGSADNIVYRLSPLSSIALGPAHVLMSGAFNNTSSTRSTVQGEAVIVASSSTHLVGVRYAFPVDSSGEAGMLLFAGGSPAGDGTGATDGKGSGSSRAGGIGRLFAGDEGRRGIMLLAPRGGFWIQEFDADGEDDLVMRDPSLA